MQSLFILPVVDQDLVLCALLADSIQVSVLGLLDLVVGAALAEL